VGGRKHLLNAQLFHDFHQTIFTAARRIELNSKNQRRVLTAGLESLLRSGSKIGDEYDALAELLEDAPAGLFLAWVVIEQEAHHNILYNIIRFLKHSAPEGSVPRVDAVDMHREAMLCWVNRLKTNEQAVVTSCRSLKRLANGVNEELVDTLLDALVMDSQKHQRVLAAVEKAIENMIMSRPQ